MGDSTIAPSSTINPLVSRLDRLDFLMKYLERRTKFEGNNNNNNMKANGGAMLERPKGCLMAMDLAVKEAESKGSLVERVAALESRLFQVKRAINQISLDMDQSSGTSQSSSSGACSQTSGDGSTLTLRSKGESSDCSLPTLNCNPNYGNTRICQVHVMTTTHEIEENFDVETQNIVPSYPPNKQKSKKNTKEKMDKKSCQSGKKRTLPNWTHLRLLGC